MLKITLKYTFFLFFAVIMNIFSQSLQCNICKKKIEGKYLAVDGKAFHFEHFKCSKCGNLINGSYSKRNGKYYHENCFYQEQGIKCTKCNKLIEGEYFILGNGKYHSECLQRNSENCASCSQPIQGKYYVKDNKKYHSKCFTDNISEKCDVCLEPIVGKYLLDSHGNKYHNSHKNSIPKCDNCNRIISKKTTSGGKKYSDGRDMCNLCFNKAITGYLNVQRLLNSVLLELGRIGIKVDNSNIKIEVADRNKLRNVAKGSYSTAMKGYCSTLIKTTTIGVVKSVDKFFTIYVLDGIPNEYLASTIAHELMHVWFIQNTNSNHSSLLTEGSCNYASYLYLKSQYNRLSNEVIKALDNDPDHVYGDGYRRVKMKFQSSSVRSFLNYLKNNTSI